MSKQKQAPLEEQEQGPIEDYEPSGGWYVISPLNHDGVLHEPGERIDLPVKTAEALRKLGVISAVAPKTDAS